MALTKITEKSIKDGEILNADINASAAIAGSKISPNFGSQNIVTTGELQMSGGNSHIKLVDSARIDIGTGNDLQIYHNASDGNSYIKESSSGSGCLAIDTDCFRVKNAAHSENLLAADEDGAVQLFYDNVKKFETTSAGVTVTGALSTTSLSATGGITGTGGNFILGDSASASDDRLTIGAGGDLHVYHDGTDSYVSNATGDLNLFSVGGSADDVTIRAQDDIFLQPNNGAAGLTITGGGGILLYHNAAQKFETTANGAKIESGSANFEVYSSTDDEDAKITIIGKTASGGVGQAGRVEIVGESTNNSNGASAMHLRTRKTNNTVTTAVTIKDDQKVGIGTTSPQQLLHVWPDAANTTSSYVRVTAGDRNSGTGLDLGHDSSGNCHVNAISNAHLIFSSNNTERMRVLNAGGLTFNGDTAAANALDDYEEGSWTPGNSDMSVTVHYARYTKVGRFVHIVADVEYASTPSDTSQVGYLTGLPFVNENQSVHQHLPWFGGSAANNNQFSNTWFTPLIFANDDKFSFLDSRYGTYLPRSTLASKKVRINSTYCTNT